MATTRNTRRSRSWSKGDAAPAGTLVRTTYDAKPVNFDELVDRARAIVGDADPYGVLTAIAEIAWRVFPPLGPQKDEKIAPHQLAFAMLAVVCATADAIVASTADGWSDLEWNCALQLIQSAFGIQADALRTSSGGERVELLTATMLESAIHQPALQHEVLFERARVHILTGLANCGPLPADADVAIASDRLARRKYGRSAAEVSLLGFMSWAPQAYRRGRLATDAEAAAHDGTSALLSNLAGFALANAVRASDVGKLVRKAAANGRTEALAAEIFGRYPFIDVGQGRVVPAPAPYLTELIGMGLLRDLGAVAVEEARAAGHTEPHQNGFSEAVGKQFERYATTLLAARAPRETIPAFEFWIGNDRLDSPDIIVIDRNQNDAVIIECKKRVLPRDAYFGIKPEAWAGVLRDPVAESICQAARAVERLFERDAVGPRDDQVHRLVERLRSAKRWHFVALFPQFPSIFVIPGMRQAIAAAVDRRASETDDPCRSWRAWRTSGQVGSTLPMAAADFELLLGLGLARDLGKSLRGFWAVKEAPSLLQGPALASMTMRNFILREGARRAGTIRRSASVLPELVGVMEQLAAELPATFAAVQVETHRRAAGGRAQGSGAE